MSTPADIAPRASYPAQLATVSWRALAQLVRAPSHSRRAEAARRLARHSLWLSAAGAAVIIALMIAFDSAEIQLMPARGTPGLWPIRILTDFGKDEYVLSVLGVSLVAVALVATGFTAPAERYCLASALGCSSCFCLLPYQCSSPRS